jgi:hypothetical protein
MQDDSSDGKNGETRLSQAFIKAGPLKPNWGPHVEVVLTKEDRGHEARAI